MAAGPPQPPARSTPSSGMVIIVAALMIAAGYYGFSQLNTRLDAAEHKQARSRRTLQQLESELSRISAKVTATTSRTIDVARITARVEESVFTIYFPTVAEWESQGTGFVVAADENYSYIATNYHVIDAAGEGGSVELAQAAQRWVGTVHSTDPERDLALIQVEDDFAVLQSVYDFGRTPRQGEPVMALGSPYGLEDTATVGVISALRPDEGEIQTDAAINHGNSGGPLLNARGQVLGITSSAFEGGASGLGFAIDIQKLCESLLTGGSCD